MIKTLTQMLFVALCILFVGCAMLTRSPAEKSTDPDVIEAVAEADVKKQRADDTSKLVVISMIALIGGIALRFASNALLPKSTGIGIGLAVGGGTGLAIARFDAALQRVALPAIAIIGGLVVLYVAHFLVMRFIKTRAKRGSDCKPQLHP